MSVTCLAIWLLALVWMSVAPCALASSSIDLVSAIRKAAVSGSDWEKPTLAPLMDTFGKPRLVAVQPLPEAADDETATGVGVLAAAAAGPEPDPELALEQAARIRAVVAVAAVAPSRRVVDSVDSLGDTAGQLLVGRAGREGASVVPGPSAIAGPAWEVAIDSEQEVSRPVNIFQFRN